VVTTGLFAASCVLLVSPATYGERCKFEGEDTTCGRCLRDRCQGSIDACCTDDTCGATLGVLESCALHGDATCGDLTSRKALASHDGELATCATTRCGAVCRGFTGTSDTKCSEPVFGRGATCSCLPTPGAGNDFLCSPETYVDTLCCASDSWPAPGFECSCLPLGCHGTPEGCSCALVDTPPDQKECGGPGAGGATTCCVSLLDPDQCVCRGSCFDQERKVPSCSLAAADANGPAIGCKKGQKRVASCTLRSP
jgi:hypothetical protein